MREARWERALQRGLECLGREENDLQVARKGDPWKVALARSLRENDLVPHTWLTKRLKMGTPNALSSLISRHRKQKGKADEYWEKL